MLPAVSVDPRRAPPAPAVTVTRPGRHPVRPAPSMPPAATVTRAGASAVAGADGRSERGGRAGPARLHGTSQ